MREPYVYIPGNRNRDRSKVPTSRQVDDAGKPISVPFPVKGADEAKPDQPPAPPRQK